MIIKKVNEFGNKTKRQRIDINKGDGLTPGSEVVIIPLTKYEDTKQKVLELKENLIKKNQELQLMQDQEQNLKEIIADVTAPIDEHYKKELKKKDDKIKQLELQLKTLQLKTNQFNLELMGLNFIDIGILHKHKKLIKNYNDDITLLGVDPKIVNADTKAIPGEDKK